jgi:hypothetical protein
MGWTRDDQAHDGFVVALIEDEVSYPSWSDGRMIRSRFLRELRARQDYGRQVPAGGLEVPAFQVACTCGWRSRRFEPPVGARWFPYHLELGDEAVETAAHALWEQHCDDETLRLPGALTPSQAQARHHTVSPTKGEDDR